MALTQAQFEQLKIHWSFCIQAIYPDIPMIPRGADDSVASLLSTWHVPGYDKPSVAQVESALVDTVIPMVTAQEAAETAAKDGLKTALQNVAGKSYLDLTTNELKAVLAGVLYRLGGLDNDLTVRPPGQWVR